MKLLKEFKNRLQKTHLEPQEDDRSNDDFYASEILDDHTASSDDDLFLFI